MSAAILQRPKSDLSILNVPGCQFTATSLTIAPGLDFDHWQDLGTVLRRTCQGVQFWIGDWIRYGEAQYGEKYAEALLATGQTYKTLANQVYVSGRIDSSLRNETLSFSHHYAVAALTPSRQRKWLQKAEAEGWSYRQLRRAIEHKKHRVSGSLLDKIFERIDDGCYSVEAIMTCLECGKNMFGLEADDIKACVDKLVATGKVEWRPQGGRKEDQPGEMPMICVPKGTPIGR